MQEMFMAKEIVLLALVAALALGTVVVVAKILEAVFLAGVIGSLFYLHRTRVRGLKDQIAALREERDAAVRRLG
jgi:hypothetical protein